MKSRLLLGTCMAVAFLAVVLGLVVYLRAPGQYDQPLITIEAHPSPMGTGRITAIDFSPDGRFLMSASADATVKLWNPHTGALVSSLQIGKSKVEHAEFSPDSQTLLVMQHDGVGLWSVPFGPERMSLPYSGSYPLSAAFSPDGKMLAYGGMARAIDVRDANTGELQVTLNGGLRGGKGAITSLAFTSDGLILASASEDGVVLFWDMETMKEKSRMKVQHGLIRCVAFSPDDTVLAVGADGNLELIDTDTFQRKHLLACCSKDDSVWSLAFSPDGNTVAAGGGYSYPRIKLWDLNSGRLKATLQSSRFGGHKHGAIRLAFSPDGRCLATGAWDGKVCIWRVPMLTAGGLAGLSSSAVEGTKLGNEKDTRK